MFYHIFTKMKAALRFSTWAQSILLPFGIFGGEYEGGKTYRLLYLKWKRKREAKQTSFSTSSPENTKFDTKCSTQASCFPSQSSFLRKNKEPQRKQIAYLAINVDVLTQLASNANSKILSGSSPQSEQNSSDVQNDGNTLRGNGFRKMCQIISIIIMIKIFSPIKLFCFLRFSNSIRCFHLFPWPFVRTASQWV